jgi:protein-S-isoprenylcysteine O-methyltransferase Ste14
MTALEAVSYLFVWIYLLSFLALTAVAQLEAGRSVWLFGRGKEKQTLPALLFRFAFIGAAVWPLVRLITGDIPADDPIRSALDGNWIHVLGASLIVTGAYVAILSQRHMGASWRIGAAEGEIGPIVDDGPFALSRNPVFVGQALLFVGLFLVLPGVISLALTAALLIAIHLQVTVEERVLAVTMGAPYKDYLRRVPRWIGVPQRD